jgi:enolase
MGVETFHHLKAILKKKGLQHRRGRRGRLRPGRALREEALEIILDAVKAAGLKAGTQVSLALDVAASELLDGKRYAFRSPAPPARPPRR